MNNPSPVKNDQLSVTIEREPRCYVRLKVTVSPEAVKEHYRNAIKAVAKEVSVPGFRKGKAPADMIVKNFKGSVDQEWQEQVVNRSFVKAFELAGLEPINQESVKNVKLDHLAPNEEARITYEYETQPEVPDVDVNALVTPHAARKQVSEEDIAKNIRNIRLNFAEWKEITDRPANDGDFVEIDATLLSAPERQISPNQLIEVSATNTPKWLYRLVKGTNVGDVREGMSEDEGHDDCDACEDGTHTHEHHHDFTPENFQIKVTKVKEAILPELNDEFAKKIGAESIEDFNTKLRQNLNTAAENEYQDKLRASIQKELLAKYPFETPYHFINKAANTTKQNFIRDLLSQGLSQQEVAQQTQIFQQDWEMQYEESYRFDHLIAKFVKKQQIQVNEEEVISEWIRRNIYQSLQKREQPASLENLEQEKNQIRREKIINKALDKLLEMKGA